MTDSGGNDSSKDREANGQNQGRNSRPRSANSPAKSDGGPNNNRRRQRNNSRRRNNNRGPNQEAQAAGDEQQKSNNPRRPQRNSNRRSQSADSRGQGNRGGRSQSRNHQSQRNDPNKRRVRVKNLRSGALIKRYGELWEQQQESRKHLFELYFRVDDRRRTSLERRHTQATGNLRKFEAALQDWQWVVLKNHFKFYAEDQEYSTNHELELYGENPGEGPFENPHILETQIKRENYSEDKEVSEGTWEDFEAYKQGK